MARHFYAVFSASLVSLWTSDDWSKRRKRSTHCHVHLGRTAKQLIIAFERPWQSSKYWASSADFSYILRTLASGLFITWLGIGLRLRGYHMRSTAVNPKHKPHTASCILHYSILHCNITYLIWARQSTPGQSATSSSSSCH